MGHIVEISKVRIRPLRELGVQPVAGCPVGKLRQQRSHRVVARQVVLGQRHAFIVVALPGLQTRGGGMLAIHLSICLSVNIHLSNYLSVDLHIYESFIMRHAFVIVTLAALHTGGLTLAIGR